MYISFHFSYNIARLLLLTKFSTSLSFPTYKLSITNNITFMRLRYSFAVNLAIDCNPLAKILRQDNEELRTNGDQLLPLTYCHVAALKVHMYIQSDNEINPNPNGASYQVP